MQAFARLTFKVNSDTLKLIGATLVLFAILFPLVININFMQNDDWVYYREVKNFLQGDFKISEYIEATFYTQGIMGMLFAKFFGVEKIPVLTLILAVSNFFLLTNILFKFYVNNIKHAVLIGLFFFVAPLHVYAALGFMSDIYFLFYMLLTFSFIEFYLHGFKTKHFVLANLFAIIGFFARQISIISMVAFCMILLVKKRFKAAITQMCITTLLLIYYFRFYDLTHQMEQNHAFQFKNLLDFQYTFNHILVAFFYSLAFLIPVVFAILIAYINTREKNMLTSSITLFLLSATFFFIIKYFFTANTLDNNNMYYLNNTLDRNGFFYGGTLGQKYKLLYEDVIYNYWDLATKLTISVTVSLLILNWKRFVNYYTIFAILYIGLFLIMRVVYDRYTLPLIPVTILSLFSIFPNVHTFSNKISKIILIGGFSLILFYTYNLTMEFVLLNRYIWSRAEQLVVSGKRETRISAGYAWRRFFYNPKADYRYLFYFEGIDRYKNPKQPCCYKNNPEEITIWFPFSIFENPKVFLYKKAF